MAQKIHIVLEDDIDGGEASETLTFGLDGTSYEIDLNDDNAAALRNALAGYVGNARKVSGTRGARKKSATPIGTGTSAREIRDWARSTGRAVPERGRIPTELREAFESAH